MPLLVFSTKFANSKTYLLSFVSISFFAISEIGYPDSKIALYAFLISSMSLLFSSLLLRPFKFRPLKTARFPSAKQKGGISWVITEPRITSYNVCYTKLLRLNLFFEKPKTIQRYQLWCSFPTSHLLIVIILVIFYFPKHSNNVIHSSSLDKLLIV